MPPQDVFNGALKDIRSARIREANKRDEVFLKVATSSLVLSVSFMTLTGFKSIVGANLLPWSWSFLLFSIVLQLLSYLMVEQHFLESEKGLTKWAKSGMIAKDFPDENTRWEKVTIFCNYTSYLFTILGLILFIVFGWYNISTMSNAEEKRKFANPLVMPVPQPTESNPQVIPDPTQQIPSTTSNR